MDEGYTSTTLPAFDYLGPLSTLMTDGWSMRCDVLDDVMDVMRRSAPPIGFGVLRWA